METVQFQSQVPAMRILENEHRYLSYLMNDWHTIALYIQSHEYGQEEAKQQFLQLQQLLVEFRSLFVQHAKKEEQYFFPLLGRYIGLEQGPLVSIEAEHDEILAYIDHFLHHAKGDHSMGQMGMIVRDAAEAFEILTIHFVKEESVLFPMVAQVMSKKDQDTLFNQMNTLIVEHNS